MSFFFPLNLASFIICRVSVVVSDALLLLGLLLLLFIIGVAKNQWIFFRMTTVTLDYDLPPNSVPRSVKW